MSKQDSYSNASIAVLIAVMILGITIWAKSTGVLIVLRFW